MSNSLSDVSRLYKDLVSALLKSVSEASCGSLDDLEDKEECNEIAEGRAELVNVLKTVNFELHVQEPFFTQLKDVSRLYKDLVSALLKSVSEASCGSLDDLEDKEECNEIAEGRAELVNVLKTVNFELHVQKPFFTQLKDGLKRVEGRCAAGNYNRIQSGALILFNKCLLFEVQDVRQYPSFYAMLKAESLDNVLSGVKTLTDDN
ncbi:hypothetical protein IC575_020416 [Cucumis melo]